MRQWPFISILFILSLTSSGQNEADNWYFGDHAAVNFNTGSPVTLTGSSMRAEAGCAVISDENGHLLFYTNGIKIWNSIHDLMPNGDSLNGSQIVNQNSIIVPKPQSPGLHYLFTVNAAFDSIGLGYSLINMNLQGGLGDMVLKNISLQQNVIEKVTAVYHCNGEDIWVITHGRDSSFYSFLITHNGIHEAVTSTGETMLHADIGYLKASPAGNLIALPVNTGNILVELYRFNDRTGELTDPIRIFKKDDGVYAYGIEFSPDGKLLYISNGGKHYRLWQYDLGKDDVNEINNSGIIIAEGNNYALQLSADGKIYIAAVNRPYLSIINEPAIKGKECLYETDIIDLEGHNSLMGLPNFIQSYFYRPDFSMEGSCYGDITQFFFAQDLSSDSLLWTFGDESSGEDDHSNELSPFHSFSDTGSYHVRLIIYHCGKSDTAERDIRIYPMPYVDLGSDTAICNSCSLMLDAGAGYDDYLWEDGSTGQYHRVMEAGTYWVTVNNKGCIASDSIRVTRSKVKLMMPNAFTPNNDGRSDIFMAVSNEPVTEFNMVVYNRWGSLVFRSRQAADGWDGTCRGETCAAGIYIWEVAYSFYEEATLIKETRRGSLMLVR